MHRGNLGSVCKAFIMRLYGCLANLFMVCMIGNMVDLPAAFCVGVPMVGEYSRERLILGLVVAKA